jgi:hypothetical protein
MKDILFLLKELKNIRTLFSIAQSISEKKESVINDTNKEKLLNTLLQITNVNVKNDNLNSEEIILKEKIQILTLIQTYIALRKVYFPKSKIEFINLSRPGFFTPNRNEKITIEKIHMAKKLQKIILTCNDSASLKQTIQFEINKNKTLVRWTPHSTGEYEKCLEKCYNILCDDKKLLTPK